MILGMDFFYFLNWFFAFSIFGYILECVVLTIENRRLVLDRGFVHGPFCIIYSFGALGGYLFLKPISGNLVLLYFASMALATTMELVTAHVMIRLFGSFWWDYSKKKFNYKGMICLESSIGWGFLGIFFFYALDKFVHGVVRLIPPGFGAVLGVGLLVYYVIDFSVSMYQNRKNRDEEGTEERIGRMRVAEPSKR